MLDSKSASHPSLLSLFWSSQNILASSGLEWVIARSEYGLHKSKRIAFHTRLHLPALQQRKHVNKRNQGANDLLQSSWCLGQPCKSRNFFCLYEISDRGFRNDCTCALGTLSWLSVVGQPPKERFRRSLVGNGDSSGSFVMLAVSELAWSAAGSLPRNHGLPLRIHPQVLPRRV